MKIKLKDNELRELAIRAARAEEKARDLEDAQLSYRFKRNLVLLDRGIPADREIKRVDLKKGTITVADREKSKDTKPAKK